jgi:hypothetical protein
MFGLAPHGAVFQLGVDLHQAVTLGIVVKDSPGARQNALSGL